jgi:transposase
VRRHELSDEEWRILGPLLVGRMGRPPKVCHREFLNAVLWKIRTGVPWRDLPERYGAWKTIYSRFRRWALAGHFTAIFEALHIEVDNEWNAIDGSYIRAHQHSAGGKGGPSETLLACLAEAVPLRSMRALMHKADLSRSR